MSNQEFKIYDPVSELTQDVILLTTELESAVNPSSKLFLYNEMITPPGGILPKAYLLIVGTSTPSSNGQAVPGESFLVQDASGNNVWDAAVANAHITWKSGIQNQFYPIPVTPGVHTQGSPLEIDIPGNVSSCRVYFLIATSCWVADATYAEGDPRVFGPPADPYRVNDVANCNDFTAGAWGLNPDYPNFGGKCEFTITSSQIWMNTTNVDNYSLPTAFKLDVTIAASGTGTLPTDGSVGFNSTRKQLIAALENVLTSNPWWDNVPIQGSSNIGPVIMVNPTSAAMGGGTISLSQLPCGDASTPGGGVLRVTSPASFDRTFAGSPAQPNKFQEYIDSIWSFWTQASGRTLKVYGKNSAVWSGNAVGNVFTFTLETPGVPPAATYPASITIDKTGSDFWWNTFNCTGQWVTTGNDDDGLVKTNFSAALNRHIIPVTGLTTLGPDLCSETPYPISEINNGMNLYARVLHEYAYNRRLQPNTSPVSAVYAFPYDDSCEISTTISVVLKYFVSATMGLTPW